MAVIGVSSSMVATLRYHRERWNWFAEMYRTNQFPRSVVFINWLTKYSQAIQIFKEKTGMGKSKDKAFKWNGYANVDIPANRMDSAESYIADDKEVWHDLVQALLAGYQIKLAYQSDDDSYRCTLVCHAGDDSNFGMALSGWGSDVWLALGSVLYKHWHIADTDWSGYSKPTDGSFG